MEEYSMKIIGKIHTDFPEKFGLPRQSGLVKGLKGKIIFEPEFRDFAAVRELEGYSHIWILWLFSEFSNEEWSPTVRPPRLGGNKRVGVFATRSPNRPNPIGLSAVKLERVYVDQKLGPIIEVSGIDMTDGTPILDIKPYLSFADSIEGAVSGFADEHKYEKLDVVIPDEVKSNLTEDILEKLYEILEADPRPRYHNDPNRVYGFRFGEYEIKFTVDNGKLRLTRVEPVTPDKQ